MGVVDNPAQYQIIIGGDVGDIYKEFIKLGNFGEGSSETAADEPKKI